MKAIAYLVPVVLIAAAIVAAWKPDGQQTPAAAEPSPSTVESADAPGQIAADHVQARQNLAAAQTQVAIANVRAVRATADAKATVDAQALAIARSQATATAITQSEAKATAHSEAVATASQIERNTDATATAAAFAFQQTATSVAAAAVSQQTATAAASQTAQAVAAQTAAAVALQASVDQKRAEADTAAIERDRIAADAAAVQWQAFWQTARLAIQFLGIVFIGAVLAVVVWGMTICVVIVSGLSERQRIENERLRVLSSLFQLRTGGVIAVLPDPANPGQRLLPQVIIDAPNMKDPAAIDRLFDGGDLSDLGDAAPITVNAGGKKVQLNRITDREQFKLEKARGLVLKLLQDAIRVEGRTDSNRIPSARRLKWHASTRDRAIKFMGARVTTREGGGDGAGTFIVEPPSLIEAYEAYHAGHLHPLLPDADPVPAISANPSA